MLCDVRCIIPDVSNAGTLAPKKNVSQYQYKRRLDSTPGSEIVTAAIVTFNQSVDELSLFMRLQFACAYPIQYIGPMKRLRFLGDSLICLREFPEDARHDAGYQLDKVQRG